MHVERGTSGSFTHLPAVQLASVTQTESVHASPTLGKATPADGDASTPGVVVVVVVVVVAVRTSQRRARVPGGRAGDIRPC